MPESYATVTGSGRSMRLPVLLLCSSVMIPCLKGGRVTLRQVSLSDADALSELTEDAEVYRYLPTFLYEKRYEDTRDVIRRLYGEGMKKALILGVYMGDEFCGLAEIYGYRPALRKASVGYRLLRRYWGKGIATEALGLMVKYLLEETSVEVVTASTMIKNQASANVLKKNGFRRVLRGVWENWGFGRPTAADKWLRTGIGYRRQYRFQT